MSRRNRCNTLPGRSGASLKSQAIVSKLIDSALIGPRAALDGAAAIAQLADDMRQASQREGGVTRDDLKLLGWTGAQIDTLADRARTRAQSLSGAAA